MRKKSSLVMLTTSLSIFLFVTGCVERKLTINTEPQGAMIILNDEEIGTSPVTVSFEWYGDYWVRIRKDGYENLDTHRLLKSPWYDIFPFDFFAQVINPGRTVDSYEWTFPLKTKKQITQEELLQSAEKLKKQLR
ncbi:MAG: PEGA domain-containing protein [Sedimentisphaerales bacterium]|nr:PEGA domain-containing protein [Sedimentisphaerales bacterium]